MKERRKERGAVAVVAAIAIQIVRWESVQMDGQSDARTYINHLHFILMFHLFSCDFLSVLHYYFILLCGKSQQNAKKAACAIFRKSNSVFFLFTSVRILSHVHLTLSIFNYKYNCSFLFRLMA